MYVLCVYSLEVNLQKRSEGPLWSELVLGDKRGQYIVDEEQAAQLHQRLAYLTAEELVCHVLFLSSSLSLYFHCHTLCIVLHLRISHFISLYLHAILLLLYSILSFQNANLEKDKPPCNAQELEDCDGFPDDSSTLMRFDGATLNPTHVVSQHMDFTHN